MKLTYNSKYNSYSVNKYKSFNSTEILVGDLRNIFDFAYEMCFGEGHHRNHRTGGQYDRKNGEMFCNTFQGKLAEVVLYNLFISNGINCDGPDFGIYGKGVWDDSDLVINGKKINVKSVAHFSNLLLLETKDWNSLGQYIPNLNAGSTSTYDYFILVRIQPDIKKILRNNRYFYANEVEKEKLEEVIFSEIWKYDIAGYISNDELIEVVKNKDIIPQNALINGRIPLDAENYYVQSGDMRDIIDLVKILLSSDN
jgi:hypothetical protein